MAEKKVHAPSPIKVESNDLEHCHIKSEPGHMESIKKEEQPFTDYYSDWPPIYIDSIYPFIFEAQLPGSNDKGHSHADTEDPRVSLGTAPPFSAQNTHNIK